MFSKAIAVTLITFATLSQAIPVFNEKKGKWEYDEGDPRNDVKNLGSQKNLFQGDIMGIPKNGSKFRNAIAYNYQKWPNAIVPFEVVSYFSNSQLTNIAKAIRIIQAQTCVRFKARSNEKDYIFFQNTAEGCSSFVGKQGGAQRVSLQRGASYDDFCLKPRSITHELLHVLGLWHEHTRQDRDSYLTINWDNVEPQYRHNFNKVDSQISKTYGTNYDYRSIMHYEGDAGGINPNVHVMITKDKTMQNLIGTFPLPTATDFYKINSIYNCCADSANDCRNYISYCNYNYNVQQFCRATCGRC